MPGAANLHSAGVWRGSSSSASAAACSFPRLLLPAVVATLLAAVLLPAALGQPAPRMTNTMRYVYLRYTGAGSGCNGGDAYLPLMEVQVGPVVVLLACSALHCSWHMLLLLLELPPVPLLLVQLRQRLALSLLCKQC
jgi:hypothetical protein